jgi:ferredoxin
MRVMKLHLNTDLCVGHGRCYALAPDVFGPDDYGHCEILVPEPEGAQLDQARIGVENCPERALTLTED